MMLADREEVQLFLWKQYAEIRHKFEKLIDQKGMSETSEVYLAADLGRIEI